MTQSQKAVNQQKMETLLSDPALMRSAKRIYRTYCVLHTKIDKNPSGVAIHREHHRGQLIFHPSPILLPGEYFIPVKQLESESL